MMHKIGLGLLLLVIAALAGAEMPAIDIGRLVDLTSKVATANAPIPVEREIEIGRGLAASMLGASPLYPDDGLQRYINHVGRWLADRTERASLPWHFAVLDTETVNAFAAPGGYIFVTKGLLRVAGSESELAGVLAHEIGHVLRSHHLEAIRKQAMAGIVADVAGMFAGNRGVDLGPLIGIGMQVYARGLDRDDEFEADRIGVVVATRGGYEPYGLPRVLLAMNAMNPAAGNLSLLSSTHPPFPDRLARLEQLMLGRFDAYAAQPQLAERYQGYCRALH